MIGGLIIGAVLIAIFIACTVSDKRYSDEEYEKWQLDEYGGPMDEDGEPVEK